MTEIFISYRREDSRSVAGHLAESLTRAFGHTTVFMDIDAIRIGDKWKDVIETALNESSIVIVVIGPQWLFLQDEHGRRRLDNEDDWVRMEVLAGLKAGRTMLPIRVSGADLPIRGALPDCLQPMLDSQAYQLSEDNWERDSKFLVERLEELGVRRTSSDTDVSYPVPIDHSVVLTVSQLNEWLSRLGPDWKIDHRDHPAHPGKQTDELYRVFKFRTFEDAIHFMNTASRFVSNHSHHPDWQNLWVSVKVWLSTWDVGHQPTHKDVQLASYLEKLYRDYKVS